MSDYLLKKFLEIVTLSQYEKDNSANENQFSYKKVAKDVMDVIMEDDFLEGHCAAILNKKLEVRSKNPPKMKLKCQH